MGDAGVFLCQGMWRGYRDHLDARTHVDGQGRISWGGASAGPKS